MCNAHVELTLKSFIHRNIGVGTSTAAARIGSICAPFIVYSVSVYKSKHWRR